MENMWNIQICPLGLLVTLFHIFGSVYAISENFVTELCPGSVGPSYGEVVRFHPSQGPSSSQSNATEVKWPVPSSDLDCWITLRGQPNVAGEPKRQVTLEFRDRALQWDYTVRGVDFYGGNNGANSSTDPCESAYIEVYDATSSGVFITPPAIGPTCGFVPPQSFTTSSNIIVLHVYVKAPPKGANAGTQVVTSGNSSFGGPYIAFTADFTSYFIGNCSEDGTYNDDKQLYCFTGRCIQRSLRCDRFFSNNCGDRGDIIAGAPGYCIVQQNNDTDSDVNLLPLWIILGIIALLALLYWCCWRPGYCPWRLWRLRNCRCCNRLCCHSCKGNKCCQCKGCTRTDSGYPEVTPAGDGRVIKDKSPSACCGCCQHGSPNDDGDEVIMMTAMGDDIIYKADTRGQGSVNVAYQPWWEFTNGDGCHIRESR